MYFLTLNLKPEGFRSKFNCRGRVTCLVFLWTTVFLLLGGLSAGYSASGETNIISGIETVYADGSLQVTMKGNNAPVYTAYELFKPARIVVDVADSKLDGGVSLSMPAESGVTFSSKRINSIMPALTRFIFTLDESRPFSVLEQGNDILVSIAAVGNKRLAADIPPVAGRDEESGVIESKQKDEISSLIADKKNIVSQLPEIDPLEQAAQVGGINAAGFRQDAFAFGGYGKERITVDFFKIDLHNVFRLLREVSGQNIVVHEAVSGSLTLALNDVPWDFALDIILNLKGLQKEERFNTIVILPGGQEFFWPERAEDNLAFEADLEAVAQEALLIQQQENIPLIVVEARELINKGHKLESQDKLEKAVMVYEEALRKWPDNARLAGRISSIYLVQLRQNAKALFFARKALAVEPKSNTGLLNAAIASANMRDIVQARQYFDRAVMSKKPSKEALLNYAVFSEEHQYYGQALKLLKKHNSLYGEDLHSMLARARILDKQGKVEEATVAYRRILLSGYRITPDLRNFIQGRTALNKAM